MTQEQVQAAIGLGIALSLVVAARQIARSQGPVLGISAGMAPLLIGGGAWLLASQLGDRAVLHPIGAHGAV